METKQLSIYNNLGIIDNKYNTWLDIPISKRIVKETKLLTWEANPFDKGFQTLIRPFVSKDDMRTVMKCAYFESEQIIASDAHVLIVLRPQAFLEKQSFEKSKKNKKQPIKEVFIDKKYQEKLFQFTKKEVIEFEDYYNGEKRDYIAKEMYPKYLAVIPQNKDFKFIHEVDFDVLKLFCTVSLEFVTEYSKLLNCVYGQNQRIGFKADLLLKVCDTFLKLGIKKGYAMFVKNTSAVIFSTTENTFSELFILIMPMMFDGDSNEVQIEKDEVLFQQDTDYGRYLLAHWNFAKNGIISKTPTGEKTVFYSAHQLTSPYQIETIDKNIIQGNITKKQFDFIKNLIPKKARLPILENIAIRNNQLFVTNLEYTFVLNNPGLENNKLFELRKGFFSQTMSDVEDFPNLPENFERIGTIDKDELLFNLQLVKHLTYDKDDINYNTFKLAFENGILYFGVADARNLFFNKIINHNIKKEFDLNFTSKVQLINFLTLIENKDIEVLFNTNKPNEISNAIFKDKDMSFYLRTQNEGRQIKLENYRNILEHTVNNEFVLQIDRKEISDILKNNPKENSFKIDSKNGIVTYGDNNFNLESFSIRDFKDSDNENLTYGKFISGKASDGKYEIVFDRQNIEAIIETCKDKTIEIIYNQNSKNVCQIVLSQLIEFEHKNSKQKIVKKLIPELLRTELKLLKGNNLGDTFDNFDGIKIKIHKETTQHHLPHFHVIFGEYNISINILNLEIIVGNLPKNILRKVMKWAKKNQDKLKDEYNSLNKK